MERTASFLLVASSRLAAPLLRPPVSGTLAMLPGCAVQPARRVSHGLPRRPRRPLLVLTVLRGVSLPSLPVNCSCRSERVVRCPWGKCAFTALGQAVASLLGSLVPVLSLATALGLNCNPWLIGIHTALSMCSENVALGSGTLAVSSCCSSLFPFSLKSVVYFVL